MQDCWVSSDTEGPDGPRLLPGSAHGQALKWEKGNLACLHGHVYILSQYLVNSPVLQVDWVRVMSEGNKAGLRENDIIQSVTLVTADGEVHGPDVEWSFDSISRTAKNWPSVFALLMIVLNF